MVELFCFVLLTYGSKLIVLIYPALSSFLTLVLKTFWFNLYNDNVDSICLKNTSQFNRFVIQLILLTTRLELAICLFELIMVLSTWKSMFVSKFHI